MSKYTAEVGRLPFAGKHIIRDVSRACLRERDAVPKTVKTLGGLVFMSFMVAVHAYQAKLGCDAFFHDAASFEQGDESVLRRAQAVVDVVYAGANAAVGVAQTYIGYRMARSLVKRLRGPGPKPVMPFEVGIDCGVGMNSDTKQEGNRGSGDPIVANKFGNESDVSQSQRPTPVEVCREAAATLGGQAVFLASYLS